MPVESFIHGERSRCDTNPRASSRKKKKIILNYLFRMVVLLFVLCMVLKFSGVWATSPSTINNRNLTDFFSLEDAENDCISQRNSYAEMISEYKNHASECENEIQLLLRKITSEQRTRAQLHYLNQKCRIQTARLDAQNSTIIVENDTGSHLSCEEDVGDFEFQRYLVWMDSLFCDYKKLEIQNQQAKIQQETNALADTYDNCNAHFEFSKEQKRVGL